MDVSKSWSLMNEVALSLAAREGWQAAAALRQQWTENYYRLLAQQHGIKATDDSEAESEITLH